MTQGLALSVECLENALADAQQYFCRDLQAELNTAARERGLPDDSKKGGIGGFVVGWKRGSGLQGEISPGIHINYFTNCVGRVALTDRVAEAGSPDVLRGLLEEHGLGSDEPITRATDIVFSVIYEVLQRRRYNVRYNRNII